MISIQAHYIELDNDLRGVAIAIDEKDLSVVFINSDTGRLTQVPIFTVKFLRLATKEDYFRHE